MPDKNSNFLGSIVFFFFLIFVFSSTFSIALSQISLGISLVAFIIFAVTKKYNPFTKQLRPIYYVIGLYLLWMVVTSVFNHTPMKSLTMLKEEWLFCIIPIGIFLFRQRQYRHILLIALAAGVVLISIYGVIQHFTGVNWFKHSDLVKAGDGTYYAAGAFSHNLTYGNFVTVAAMFLVSIVVIKAKEILKMPFPVILIGGVMGFVGTVMSYSRMAIATIPVALLALAWLKGKRWALVSFGVVAVIAVLSFFVFGELAFKYKYAFKRDLTGQHDASRMFIWKKTLSMVSDNPIIGVGQGNYEREYERYLDRAVGELKSRPHAHNDILNYAAISGIPGALIFILLWIVVFYKLHIIYHSSNFESDKKIFAGAAAIAGLTFFLTSLTEATFADEEVRQLLMVVWAAGIWPLYSCKEDENSEQPESA